MTPGPFSTLKPEDMSVESPDLFGPDPSIDLSKEPGYLEWLAERMQAAERLREWLSLSPFYAQRAQKAREMGGAKAEMAYWLDLQGSCATLKLPTRASASSTAGAV
jgi:hypothetical protein